jgi:hypothetical protein
MLSSHQQSAAFFDKQNVLNALMEFMPAVKEGKAPVFLDTATPLTIKGIRDIIQRQLPHTSAEELRQIMFVPKQDFIAALNAVTKRLLKALEGYRGPVVVVTEALVATFEKSFDAGSAAKVAFKSGDWIAAHVVRVLREHRHEVLLLDYEDKITDLILKYAAERLPDEGTLMVVVCDDAGYGGIQKASIVGWLVDQVSNEGMRASVLVVLPVCSKRAEGAISSKGRVEVPVTVISQILMPLAPSCPKSVRSGTACVLWHKVPDLNSFNPMFAEAITSAAVFKKPYVADAAVVRVVKAI